MMQNGYAPTAAMGIAPDETALADMWMSPYSKEDIIELTDTHERDVQPLRDRMERDYGRYRLNPHVIKDRKTGDILTNYAVYTSNTPRVFADKVISWQNLAELLIRVPHVEAGEHEEEIDNLKERFAIGCLRAADERLRRRKEPSLRQAQSTYVTLRGGYVGGRALLVNGMDGKSYVDVTAWDPMNIHWGTNADGLEWACYKTKKTLAQIRAEYPGYYKQRYAGDQSKSTDAEHAGIWHYDFYDQLSNTVICGGEVLKPPTPHGSPRVPAYLSLVGPAPLLQSEIHSNLIADVGESVYAGARDVFEKNNDIMSIMLEIVERARRQTVITESRDGKKTLPEDVFEQGTEVAVATGERIYTLELQKMAQETGAYMVQVAGEVQRATLPFSSWGETPFQLSGFAITQLRQATETVLASRIAALEDVYLQIVELLYDQFMTGAFEGLKLSGRDSGRNYFNQTITPDVLAVSCDYTVQLVPQLPQDDMGKWTMAQTASQTQLLSKADILDKVLGLQDSQQALDKLKIEMAEQGLPEALLYTMAMAAAKQGNWFIANTYLLEYQRLIAVKAGLMPPTGDEGAVQGQQPEGTPQGAPPQVLPYAATGAPPPAETSNAGSSLVAPGTPRPGARGRKKR